MASHRPPSSKKGTSCQRRRWLREICLSPRSLSDPPRLSTILCHFLNRFLSVCRCLPFCSIIVSFAGDGIDNPAEGLRARWVSFRPEIAHLNLQRSSRTCEISTFHCTSTCDSLCVWILLYFDVFCRSSKKCPEGGSRWQCSIFFHFFPCQSFQSCFQRFSKH